MTQVTGILQWPQRAEGRLRQFDGQQLVENEGDPFVPVALGDEYPLRDGLEITAEVVEKKPRRRKRADGSPAPRNPRPVVDRIVKIEGIDPDEYSKRPRFEDLESVDPQPRLTLEYKGCPPACRLIDMFCPIGRGQRGLIVAPPKSGKTILLKQIAEAISHNHPDIELYALLVDERPEEVTDFRRSTPAHVFASSSDHDIDRHTAVSMTVIERCRNMVEAGKHVCVLLDSLTRLGRAFNNSRKYGNSGKTMSGGVDARALEIPKRLFGSARNTEAAGSLTVLATCLVDTGSQGDQVIFEEFKGTGNMELVLDRKIAERRVYPAINLAASGTRKEHLLMDPKEFETISALRRRLLNMHPHQQIEQLLGALGKYETNAELVGLGK